MLFRSDGTNTFNLRFRGANNWAVQYAPSTDEWSLQRNSVNQYSADGSSHIWSFPAGEAMRLTSTGLGIGTSSPSYKLQLNSGSAVDIETAVSNSAGLSRFGTRGSGNSFVGAFTSGKALELWSAGSLNATLDSFGNLGIGTSSPGAKLEVNAGANTDIRVNTSGSGYLQLGQFTNGAFISTSSSDATAGVLRFGTGGTERARITSGGDFLVGRTSASGTAVGLILPPDGNIQAFNAGSTNATLVNAIYSTGASAYRFYVGMAGTVYATNTTIKIGRAHV